ncbi:MAG: hypothetical protein ACR2PS_05980 [Pseudomonadales bacterium]
MTGRRSTEQSSEYSVDQAVGALLSSEADPEEDTGQEEEVREHEAAPETELEPEGEEGLSPQEDEGEEEIVSEDEPDEQSAEETETLYTIDIEGEEVQVTKAELLKGYRRQSDYTRKFQDLAEQKRQAEAESQQYLAATEKYIGTIQSLQQSLYQEGIEDPDPAMEEIDPVGYLAAKDKARSRREQMAKLEQERQVTIQQHQTEAQKQFQSVVNAENAKLLEKVPEWKDPKVSKTEKSKIREYGLSQGFSEQEMGGLADHRAILMLRKAMAYDALQGEGSPERKVVRKGTKTIKSSGGNRAANSSGSSVKSREKKALERLKKSGSTEDAVEVLLARAGKT